MTRTHVEAWLARTWLLRGDGADQLCPALLLAHERGARVNVALQKPLDWASYRMGVVAGREILEALGAMPTHWRKFLRQRVRAWACHLTQQPFAARTVRAEMSNNQQRRLVRRLRRQRRLGVITQPNLARYFHIA